MALGDLHSQVVYVGGAVVSLYADDPAAEDVRPTEDVDIFLEITSFGELEQLREDLTVRGFYQSSADDVICRFHYEELQVDVMATHEVGWAPANRWFGPGLNYVEHVRIGGMTFQLLSCPFYVASKFDAFHSRGKDPRTSHDFEDIVYVLDNRKNLSKEIGDAPSKVKAFLRENLQLILTDTSMQEAIIGNLSYGIQSQRFELIMEKIRKL